MAPYRQSVIDDYNRVLDLIGEALKLAVKLDGPTTEHLDCAKGAMETVLARAASRKVRDDWLNRAVKAS